MWDELEDAALTPAALYDPDHAANASLEHGDLFAKALTDRQDLMPAIAALQDVLKHG